MLSVATLRCLPCAGKVLLATLLLAACGGASHNPTVYPFEQGEPAKLAAVRTVIIPHVNIGPPSRNYLDAQAAQIDSLVAQRLREAGLKVLPQRLFEQEWNRAARVHGNHIDPTSGRVNERTFALTLTSVRDALRKEHPELDAFVFTDIIERDVAFGSSMNRVARWDGVTRKPSLQGPGSGVSSSFDWSRPASAASLMVSIFTLDLERVFLSVGGLDTTDAIDTRSGDGRWVRRRNLLENESFLKEGVSLALHPFVPMKKYPGDA